MGPVLSVALRSDVDDIQGGTTKEGIHLGVMAGTLDLVQRYYAGVQIRDGILYFDPRLPSGSAACHSVCSSGRRRSWSRSTAIS